MFLIFVTTISILIFSVFTNHVQTNCDVNYGGTISHLMVVCYVADTQTCPWAIADNFITFFVSNRSLLLSRTEQYQLAKLF